MFSSVAARIEAHLAVSPPLTTVLRLGWARALCAAGAAAAADVLIRPALLRAVRACVQRRRRAAPRPHRVPRRPEPARGCGGRVGPAAAARGRVVGRRGARVRGARRARGRRDAGAARGGAPTARHALLRGRPRRVCAEVCGVAGGGLEGWRPRRAHSAAAAAAAAAAASASSSMLSSRSSKPAAAAADASLHARRAPSRVRACLFGAQVIAGGAGAFSDTVLLKEDTLFEGAWVAEVAETLSKGETAPE